MKRLIDNLFVGMLFTAFVFSCSDGEKGSGSDYSFKFKNNIKSVKLDGSNFFLLDEIEGQYFTHRNYVITDGEYIAGDGDDLDEYDDATYLIFIQLAVRESFSPAEYVQSVNWNSENIDFYSLIYSTSAAEEESIRTYPGDMSPIKVSGGFNDGQKMKLEFDGKLMYSRLDESGMTEINTEEEVYLFFEGTIDDRRPLD